MEPYLISKYHNFASAQRVLLYFISLLIKESFFGKYTYIKKLFVKLSLSFVVFKLIPRMNQIANKIDQTNIPISIWVQTASTKLLLYLINLFWYSAKYTYIEVFLIFFYAALNSMAIVCPNTWIAFSRSSMDGSDLCFEVVRRATAGFVYSEAVARWVLS